VIGGLSWGFAVVMSVLSLPPVLHGGSFNRWPDLTEALISQAHLGKPIVTFSNSGIATDLITVYAGDRLAGGPTPHDHQRRPRAIHGL
jgi:hypothetical protein